MRLLVVLTVLLLIFKISYGQAPIDFTLSKFCVAQDEEFTLLLSPQNSDQTFTIWTTSALINIYNSATASWEVLHADFSQWQPVEETIKIKVTSLSAKFFTVQLTVFDPETGKFLTTPVHTLCNLGYFKQKYGSYGTYLNQSNEERPLLNFIYIQKDTKKELFALCILFFLGSVFLGIMASKVLKYHNDTI